MANRLNAIVGPKKIGIPFARRRHHTPMLANTLKGFCQLAWAQLLSATGARLAGASIFWKNHFKRFWRQHHAI
jgi:hypothetical protein